MVLVLSLTFWVFGARAYAQDVAIIESEMVSTAKWVAENIPDEDLIAAHDIGALGFFDAHPLLDLAGLVTPEVVPFMRDEGQLARYLDDHAVEYLIAFPEFYPILSQEAESIHSTNGRFPPMLGGENMIVYRWR